jgi:hypothetical protein
MEVNKTPLMKIVRKTALGKKKVMALFANGAPTDEIIKRQMLIIWGMRDALYFKDRTVTLPAQFRYNANIIR